MIFKKILLILIVVAVGSCHGDISSLRSATSSSLSTLPAYVVVRPNNVSVSSLPPSERTSVSKHELIKNLINIDDQHIQYVRLENEDNKNGIFLSIETNAFVRAVHLSYAHHLPLVITPDMIWYLITSGLATHINLNAESLRYKFVSHEGKKKLSVRRDDFVFNSSSNPWHQVLDEFGTKISNYTKQNVSSLFDKKFSTSSSESIAVSRIVLMDAMKKYFEYEVLTLCGIPEIRIKGTKDDWVWIIKQIHEIIQLAPELDVWANKGGLYEILQNFIDVYETNGLVSNTQFWDEIYKVKGGSGGPYLSGWVMALFPYLKEGEKNHYVWESSWRDARNSFGGLTNSEFPITLNQVEFKWNYLGNQVDMLFLGGLFSVQYDTNEHTVTPLFGYSICEDKIKDQKMRTIKAPVNLF